MNIEARYNLQKGVPQNYRSEATTYNCDNEIDRYILAKVQMRNAANDNRVIIKEQDLQQTAHNAIEAAIDEVIKAFK